MRIPRSTPILLSLLLTLGCQPAAVPEDTSAQADGTELSQDPAAASEAPATAETPAESSMVRVDPDAMSECADPAAVMVHWDVRGSGATNVDLLAVDRRGQEKLFFTGSRVGSRESGAWMRSGTQMVVRDHADGRELGRATIASLPCAEDAPVGEG